jgi:photosystem I subunit 9
VSTKCVGSLAASALAPWRVKKMKDFTTYLSTAPVVAILSLTVVAGLLIEINRFFPDALIVAF